MCQSKKVPYDKLCELFNEDTQNGKNMDEYTELLKKVVEEIIRIFKKRSSHRLTSDRGGLLIPPMKQLQDMDNFELVTWIIVR